MSEVVNKADKTKAIKSLKKATRELELNNPKPMTSERLRRIKLAKVFVDPPDAMDELIVEIERCWEYIKMHCDGQNPKDGGSK